MGQQSHHSGGGLTPTDGLGRLKRRVFVNIEKYGNASATSIPIALTEAAECGRLQKGSLIALAAFGAGNDLGRGRAGVVGGGFTRGWERLPGGKAGMSGTGVGWLPATGPSKQRPHEGWGGGPAPLVAGQGGRRAVGLDPGGVHDDDGRLPGCPWVRQEDRLGVGEGHEAGVPE